MYVVKIAYLTNQYPKVSHTFVRREIAALEDLGHSVSRFSIRQTNETLTDEADRLEEERTRVVLASGVFGLMAGLLSCAVRHPVSLIRGILLAWKIGWRSESGMLRHCAYLAEACILLRWIRREDCQHVHSHFGTNSTTVAMLCRTLGGPPYSFTVHGPEEFDKPALIALRTKIERAAFVAGVSSFGRSQLYRHCDLRDWPKIHVVRCGVDDGFLDVEADVPPSAPRLVCVGRLCEQKGQLLLIEAAAKILKTGLDFELILVGDGEMRSEVETLIERYSLSKRVTITGWATNEEVRQQIRQARALVLPSFAEGLPVVIMEALALCRPVVSTYVAGIPELVEPGACGWLAPAGSVDDLVVAMREALLASPEELLRLGKEGQKRVCERHDARVNAGILQGLFATGDA